MIHDIDIVFNVLFQGDNNFKIHSAGNRNVCEAMAVFPHSVVSISASRLSSKKFRTFYVEANSQRKSIHDSRGLHLPKAR